MSAGNEQSVEEMNTPKKRAVKKAKNIYQKLADAKSEIGAISKDSTNPFFKSKYFDINKLIEHVEPILLKNGLLLLQPIVDGVVGTEIFDIDSGQSVISTLKLPDLNDPQKILSCITYYRRGTLASLLAIQSEDDDGNSAKPKPTPAAKPHLRIGTEAFDKVVAYMAKNGDIKEVEKKYSLSEVVRDVLITNN